MKDIDFDELDRAVNSLINKDNETETASIDGNESLSPVVDNVDTSAAVEATSQEQPQTILPSVATRRTSGRFMDVVHPSSDMRSITIPSRPISREGVNVVPLSNSANQVTSLPTPSNPVEVTETKQPAVNDWPNPISFTNFGIDETPKKASAESLEPEKVQVELGQPTVKKDDDISSRIADEINKFEFSKQETGLQKAPLESPFLSDTKVEKRPLGAFSDETTMPPDNVVPEEKPLNLETEELTVGETTNPEEDQPSPMGTDTPMPLELQDNLLRIEEDYSDVDADAAEKRQKVEEKEEQSEPQAEVLIGPTSITQQYKEEQPSTDSQQPASAIFDTEAYKKPLKHPAKKKSGWMLVLWITLLLIVGAGAGALVFFFVLPKL